MNLKLPFSHFLALRFSFSALCLLLSSGVAKADSITDADADRIADAVYSAFQGLMSDERWMTEPFNWDWSSIGDMLGSGSFSVGEMLYYMWLHSDEAFFEDGGYASKPYLKQILQAVNSGDSTNLLADIFQFLDQSAATHFNASANWRQDWYEIYGSALLNLKDNLDFVTFDNWQQVGSGSPVLSVYDEPASAKLLTLLRLLQDDIIPALQSIQASSGDQSSGLTSLGESISDAIDGLQVQIAMITQDWLTLQELENRDMERDEELTQAGESAASEAESSFNSDEVELETSGKSEVENYQQASEELVETQDFDFDMETENPYDEFDTFSKDATDKFKEVVGDSEDYTYSGSDDLVLLDTPSLDPELFPGLGVVKYNYSLHNGLRNWSQQSRRITSWAWRLLGFVMQLVLIVRFIAGAMTGFSGSEKITSDF